MLRRTGRYGDGFYPSRLTPSELSQMYARIRKYGEEAGRDMSSFTNSVYLRLRFNDSLEDAQRVSQQVIEARCKVPVKVGDTSVGSGTEDALLEFPANEPMGPPRKMH